MYIVKRIIIYLFIVVFSLLSFLYNIHSGCCCFKCTKVETDKEKKERLRREQIEKENGTAVIYDLKGKRLNSGKALNKGIYIVNGKKTVVR